MKYIKVNNKHFYIINLLVLLVFFLRQIANISFLDNYGNVILGPLIVIIFLLFSRNSTYKVADLVMVLTYTIISVAASLFLGHADYLKIFSEALSIYLFIIIIPSIEVNECEIIKIFKSICMFLILLIVIKMLVDFNIIKSYKYTFTNKNSWAQVIMFPFFVSFYLFVEENKKRYALIAIVSFVLIILSYSRTAVVATFVFVFFYYLVMSKKVKYTAILLLLIFTGAILLVLIEDKIMSFIINNYTRSGYNLLTNRNLLWGVAVDAFKSSPIFGVGRGIANEVILGSGLAMKNSEYHSFYFEVLAYGGLTSALFYCYLFIRTIINGLKLKRLNEKLGSVVLSAMASMFVYMLAETFYPFGLSFNNYISGLFIFSIPTMYIKGKIKLNIYEKV